MKVSVVVPVYNKGPWLEACFQSLFAQTYGDLEIIAVDDASTDDGLERLRAMGDPRLRIIAMEGNVGPGLAAQRGMDEARGEYILRADADDVQHPDRIAAQVAYLDEHPRCGALSAQMDLLGRPGERYTVPLEHEALRVELLFGVALFQPVMALRRSVLERHDLRYRPEWPRFGEDWMFQLELARVTRMANLDRSLVSYRVGPQNTTRGRDRHADLSFLYRHAFEAMGLPLSDAELLVHLYVAGHFHRPLSPGSLRDLHDWLRKLERMNEERGLFREDLFKARAREAWDRLFHRVPEFGWATTWAYLRRGARLSPARIHYLFATLCRWRKKPMAS